MSKGLEISFMKAKSAQKRGDFAAAEQLYAGILAQFPNNVRARKGMEALRQNQPDANIEASPPQAEVDALNDLCLAGRWDEVVERCEIRLVQYPRAPVLYDILGKANFQLKRLDRAAECFRKQTEISPDDFEAQNNLGVVLDALDRREEAVRAYERALQIKPGNAAIHFNLAQSLQALMRVDEAIACYKQALKITPDNASARAQKIFLEASNCDWEAIQSDAHLIKALGVTGSAVPPFTMLAFEDNPERHRIRSIKFAAEKYSPSRAHAMARPAELPARLRIGYFSADFHNHATMYLMAGLFEQHDHTRFAVHAYSYGPDHSDEMRHRLKSSVHAFRQVAHLSDREIAEVAHKDGIDIAIDLKGYTQGERLGIFAWRPAPIQISYIGYPGTLGAPFIDYIVADKVVIPDVRRQDYFEKIIYLPDGYQVNDDNRHIAYRIMTREEAGLPKGGFVFCCFNNSFKISPAEFDIWMRLLARVDGSVLWLFRVNRPAEDNLRKEAERRGVDPTRLVFADRMPLAEHLARHSLADLFLDTFNYNAHTTASDALWTGLPLVTKIGQGFTARVAASLLTAVGMPELITETPEDYERLALELAENPQKLAGLRARLAANRLTAPLFDSERFTRHMEAGFEQAYDRYFTGKTPVDIMIEQGADARG